jgi:hypothetical protein
MKRTPKKLYTLEVPPVSHDFVQSLSARFPPMSVQPGVNKEDLIYNAGQRSVIDWIQKTSSSGTSVSGNPEDLRKPEKQSMLAKILGTLYDR